MERSVGSAPKWPTLEELTRGIDGGATHALYHQTSERTKKGMAPIGISSELPDGAG